MSLRAYDCGCLRTLLYSAWLRLMFDLRRRKLPSTKKPQKTIAEIPPQKKTEKKRDRYRDWIYSTGLGRCDYWKHKSHFLALHRADLYIDFLLHVQASSPAVAASPRSSCKVATFWLNNCIWIRLWIWKATSKSRTYVLLQRRAILISILIYLQCRPIYAIFPKVGWFDTRTVQ